MVSCFTEIVKLKWVWWTEIMTLIFIRGRGLEDPEKVDTYKPKGEDQKNNKKQQ